MAASSILEMPSPSASAYVVSSSCETTSSEARPESVLISSLGIKYQHSRRIKIAAIRYLPFPDFLPPPEFESLSPALFVLGCEETSSFLVGVAVIAFALSFAALLFKVVSSALAFFFCLDWEEESSLLDKSLEPLVFNEDDSSPLDIFILLCFSVENPEPFFFVENPDSFFSVENPEPFFSVANPDSFFSVANPDSFFSVENPEPFFSVENPDSFFSVENPDSFFSIENPESFLPLAFFPFFLSLITSIYKHIF